MAKNPLEEYEQTKEAAKAARKQNELQLWDQWKKNGEKPEHLQPLLKASEPTFRHKIQQWKAPLVPESAFKLELQDHFINALRSYDPDRGAALNTHIERRLKKAMRYNAKNQNFGYIPEGQIGHISAINQAKDHLTQQFGRDPTTQEIADHINETGDKKLTAKRVETVVKAQKKDIPGSTYETDPVPQGTNYEESQLEIAKHMLHHIFPNKPEMHQVFGYTFGLNGFPRISSTGELAKKMGKSSAQISRMKSEMGKTLQQHMGLNKAQED